MLIRNILEESVQKFGEVKAVKWLNRKEVLERSYSEMLRNVISIRKGLLAEDFAGKHIALIGTSSVEWIESYLGIITGCTTAVPLDAALPCEELDRSDKPIRFRSTLLKSETQTISGSVPCKLSETPESMDAPGRGGGCTFRCIQYQ